MSPRLPLRQTGQILLSPPLLLRQTGLPIVPEEDWFGQPKYSTLSKKIILRCVGFFFSNLLLKLMTQQRKRNHTIYTIRAWDFQSTPALKAIYHYVAGIVETRQIDKCRGEQNLFDTFLKPTCMLSYLIPVFNGTDKLQINVAKLVSTTIPLSLHLMQHNIVIASNLRLLQFLHVINE